MREVRGSQLCRPLRRMERVREQQKVLDEAGLSGGEHRGLPSSVGMASEIEAPGKMAAH